VCSLLRACRLRCRAGQVSTPRTRLELGQMMQTSLNRTPRREHPVDVVERLAAGNEWAFERDDKDEISISVTGAWTDYQVAFSWLPDLETLHVGCAFDLKVPLRRRAETLELIAIANEQLWLGHFDLWTSEGVVMFRHALLLTGGGKSYEILNVAFG